MKTTWPFSEILRPLAQDSLATAQAPALIRRAFARQLESRLAGILSQCLYLDFTAHRMSVEVFAGSRKGCYAEFVREVTNQGLDALLKDYPVATKALAVLSRQAREYAQLLTSHLEKDRNLIARLLGCSGRLKLRGMSAGWSDPHCGGRTVVQMAFEGHHRIFYKPRALSVDLVWADGLRRINRRLPLPLRAPSVADLGDHGWAEAIPEINEVTQREAEAFYWRYGALLCLAWLLDAVDLHRDNIVICRADPVLVDAEGLLHPFGPGEERSLSRTLIVPHPRQTVDVSGLGAVASQTGRPTLHWRRLRTDDLAMVPRKRKLPAATHLPRVGKSLLTPKTAKRYIQDGFAAVVRIAAQDREAIAEWRGALAEVPRRRICRSTPFYTELLLHAAHPVNMESSRAWNRKIARWLGNQPDQNIVRAERKQLARWDIPIFETGRHEAPDLPWDELAQCQKELEALNAEK